MGFVSLQSFMDEAKGFFGLHLSTHGLRASRHRPSAFSLRPRSPPNGNNLDISLGIHRPYDDLLLDRHRKFSRTARRAFPGLSFPPALEDSESTYTGLPIPAVAPLMPILTASAIYSSFPSLPGNQPGNAHGISGGLQGVSLLWIGHRHRLPPFITFRKSNANV
jgi:hypothetical protein